MKDPVCWYLRTFTLHMNPLYGGGVESNTTCLCGHFPRGRFSVMPLYVHVCACVRVDVKVIM